MNLGRLSINQPILAMVLSIVLLIVGAIAYTTLPVSEYPQVVPPTVVVTTQYPGASAQTVSDTVAAPIEQEINGVEDMLYLYSQATSNGQLTITVTFKLGTDLDKAQVLVQNRVAIAQPRLPEEVQRNGVVTRKNSPDILMVVFMLSPDDTLRPALHLQLRAAAGARPVASARRHRRHPDVRRARLFDAAVARSRQDRHARPDRRPRWWPRSARRTCRSPAARSREPPIADRAFQPNLTFTGRLKDPKQFEDIVVKAGADGRTVRLRDVARVELGALSYTTNSFLLRKSAVALLVTQRPGSNALATAKNISDTMDEAEGQLSQGARLQYRLQPDRIHRAIRPRADQDDLRGDAAGRHRRAGVPAGLAAGDHSDHRDPGVAGRHLRGDGGARILDQQSDAVRARARGRHRGRRRHRGGRKCRAASRARHEPARCGAARPWRRSAARWSRSRWCCARCSCRPRFSAAFPDSSSSNSPSPSRSRPRFPASAR